MITVKQQRAEYQRKQAELRRWRKAEMALKRRGRELKREHETPLKQGPAVRLATGEGDIARLLQRREELKGELAWVEAELSSYNPTKTIGAKRAVVERGYFSPRKGWIEPKK